MMRLRRASVIAALSLLAWAATVSAEDWWVVWGYHLSPSTKQEQYAVAAKYSTRRDCEQTVQQYSDSLRSQGYTATGGSPGSPATLVNKEGAVLKFFCLPDTVDPRRPKGR